MGAEIHGRVPHLNHVCVLEFFYCVPYPIFVQKFEVRVYPRHVLPIARKGLDRRVYKILLDPYARVRLELHVRPHGQAREWRGPERLRNHESKPWGLGVPLDKLDKEVTASLEPREIEIR